MNPPILNPDVFARVNQSFDQLRGSMEAMGNALKEASKRFRLFALQEQRREKRVLRTVFGSVPYMLEDDIADVEEWNSDMCNAWLHEACQQMKFPLMCCQCKCHKNEQEYAVR